MMPLSNAYCSLIVIFLFWWAMTPLRMKTPPFKSMSHCAWWPDDWFMWIFLQRTGMNGLAERLRSRMRRIIRGIIRRIIRRVMSHMLTIQTSVWVIISYRIVFIILSECVFTWHNFPSIFIHEVCSVINLFFYSTRWMMIMTLLQLSARKRTRRKDPNLLKLLQAPNQHLIRVSW